MEIRKVSLGLAAAALLGATPVMAAAPVTPSAANLSLAPAVGTNLAIAGNATAGARLGATKGARASDIGGGSAVVAALAAAAVIGGVIAATDNGHSATSP